MNGTGRCAVIAATILAVFSGGVLIHTRHRLVANAPEGAFAMPERAEVGPELG